MWFERPSSRLMGSLHSGDAERCSPRLVSIASLPRDPTLPARSAARARPRSPFQSRIGSRSLSIGLPESPADSRVPRAMRWLWPMTVIPYCRDRLHEHSATRSVARHCASLTHESASRNCAPLMTWGPPPVGSPSVYVDDRFCYALGGAKIVDCSSTAILRNAVVVNNHKTAGRQFTIKRV
jgi:hypothetical protein